MEEVTSGNEKLSGARKELRQNVKSQLVGWQVAEAIVPLRTSTRTVSTRTRAGDGAVAAA